MSEAEEAAAGPGRRSWVILARIPDVAPDDDDYNFPSGRDLSFVINQPPSFSVLKLPPRMVPEATIARLNYPYIAAVDPSGRLLLCTSHRSLWPYFVSSNEHKDAILKADRKLANDYYLCDATTGEASPLPAYPADGRTLHPSSVGLIRRGGEYMVVELQIFPENRHTRLLCYSTETNAWAPKEFANSPGQPKWGNNGVITHAGKLWWVDLSFGLFTCDPFDDQPHLRRVPLPQGCELPDESCWRFTLFDVLNLYKSRCVKVSDGKLRYVQIDDGADDASKLIRTWTLYDPEGTEWTPGYVVPFFQIWADESYRAAGLQEVTPVLALIHPWNPNVVYFWQKQNSRFFAVDVPEKKVLDCKNFMVVDPPSGEYPSSHFLDAWELPPSTLHRYHDPSSDCGPVGCFKCFMAGLNLLFQPAGEEPATSASSSGGTATGEGKE